MIKEELYRWLKLERPTAESGEPNPPGYCHFPQYGEEYFKQLTAEQLVTRVVKGMLPHNTLGAQMLKKLRVYAGAEHPHQAQKTS